MRLVCPNCDAQYEVDDAAIPASGRDVQCSNCGHAWFQLHPDELDALEQEGEVFEPLPDSPPPPPPIPPEPEPDFELDFPPEPEVAEPPPAPVAAPPKRAIDANVLAVLREEAERERAVRESEPPVVIEVQQDLGLPPPPPPPPPVPPSVAAARERFRDLSVEMDEHEEDHPARPSSRRELLPDIEEINSTLRASSVRQADDDDEVPLLPAAAADTRQGFRSGFVLMMILAVVLWVGYAMAPRIAEQFPASAGMIQTYVRAVDRARVGIDAALKSATEQLRDLSGDKG